MVGVISFHKMYTFVVRGVCGGSVMIYKFTTRLSR